MSDNPIAETERLTLRQMTMADVDSLLGIFADPEAMRFYPGTKDRGQTEDWVRWNQDLYEKYGHGLWIASWKDTGAFAGQCGLVVQEVEARREIEIGYLFLRAVWGQGLATEAARACRDLAFHHFGYPRVISLIAPGNTASRRVAEKVGMSLDREIEKWNRRVCVYKLDAESGPPMLSANVRRTDSSLICECGVCTRGVAQHGVEQKGQQYSPDFNPGRIADISRETTEDAPKL